MKLLLLICIFGLVFGKGTNWAIIAAGSNGYYNYRHQADVSHAYQMLHAHGFDDAHIIQFQYDDIAQNSQNPVKGNIINHVGGVNVYPGTDKINYKGAQCTAKNFLKVLSGDKSAPGPVVESTSEDNIFVFYSDHGTTGYVCFPNDDLYAKDLIATLKQMYADKKYHEMVLYIEACESGSMFDNVLPPNINVYATTASNPTESSYACYWDDSRKAYLGDTYSVNFLEDSDVADMSTETFATQYITIQTKTNGSHVMQYGQKSMTSEPIQNFLTMGKFVPQLATKKVHSRSAPADQVLQREASLTTLQRMLSRVNSEEEKNELMAQIDHMITRRTTMERRINTIVTLVSGNPYLIHHVPHSIANHDDFKEAHLGVSQLCGRMNEYVSHEGAKIANLVNAGFKPAQIIEVARRVCKA